MNEDDPPPAHDVLLVADPTGDKGKLLEDVRNINEDIGGFARMGTKYFNKFGFALANLKRSYYVKCRVCDTLGIDDMFQVLSCKGCARLSNSKDFFAELKTFLRYDNAYINFLIQFASLCDAYPKFVFAGMPLAKVKNYMSFLPRHMAADKQFWTQ